MANEIYDALETVITDGGYDLGDVLDRIDVLYADGELSEDERAQLIQLAQDNSKPVFDVQQALSDLTVRMQELDGRVSALEGAPVEKYPAYEDGHIYRQGDGCTYNGTKYEMVLPGETSASPEVYPDAWKKVE